MAGAYAPPHSRLTTGMPVPVRYAVIRPAVRTRGKREAQIAGISDPVERHMQAALEVYRKAGRSLFELKDFGLLMAAMRENERANTNGDVNEAQTYDFGKTPALARRLRKYAEQVKEVRSNGTRKATVYGLKTARPLILKLAGATGPEVMDALAHDEDENRLSSEHVWERFCGPLQPASPRQ